MGASRAGHYAVVIVWGAAVVGVWLWTTGYGFSTYQPSDRSAHQRWPSETTLTLAHDRPTLLLFVHPRCPCTRASIRELEELLTGRGLTPQQLPELTVVATLPANASDEWRDTGTVRRARRLPNSSVIWDFEGVEATNFGAVASGAVMLYAPDGTRLFAGGVTASRGHEGGNAGADRVRATLAGGARSPQPGTPVFGCRLCGGDSAKASEVAPQGGPQGE